MANSFHRLLNATPHFLQPRDIGVPLTTAAPVRSHWRAIGHHLGFTEGQLDSMVPPNHTSHLRVLLIRWLEGAGPCTEVFIGAMRAVGAEGVARQVEMDGFLMSPWRVKYETAVWWDWGPTTSSFTQLLYMDLR